MIPVKQVSCESRVSFLRIVILDGFSGSSKLSLSFFYFAVGEWTIAI